MLRRLRDLDAVYLDHRKCGDLRAGVEERERDDGAVVWFDCECGARIARGTFVRLRR
jgi:hypothetical protein